jgi:carboxypeptidase family protein/PDZ domain-containing protein
VGEGILFAAMLLIPLAGVMLARAWTRVLPALPALNAATSTRPDPAPVRDRRPEIRGRILDAEGTAVEGADVRLVSTSPPYAVYRSTRSDVAGGFSFARVEPWRVRVVADHDPEGVVSSAELLVTEDRSTEITLVLSAAGAIRGTVVNAEDHPVAGAVLSVEGMPWIVPAATSDESGAFRLRVVPREATSLVAVARGYRTARAALARSEDRDRGELVVRVRLAAAPPVAGEVLDADGKPARARVVACEQQPSESRTSSGEDGTFELPASAIGCDAIAEHAEYAPSDPGPVVEGRRVVLRLKAGGAIEGVVLDDHGVGLRSFTVGIEVFTPAHGRAFDAVPARPFEDARGSFVWDKLAPGTYVLTASAPDLMPARSGPIDVLGGAVTRGVRIALTRGGSVTGHVYDARHQPIARASLSFDAMGGVIDARAGVETDDYGQYRLEGAPAGPFTLRVHKDGYRARLVSGLRVDPGATLTEDVLLAGADGGGGFELGGIGAALKQSSDGIALGDVFAGDPAARAGLRVGDRVLSIDGESVDSMSMADALQRLRGEAGTSVGVLAKRPETGETIEVTIVRGTIVH